VRRWEDWLSAASSFELPTDLAPRPALMYTSGTTGRPKGTEQPPTMFAGGSTIDEHIARLRDNRFAAFGMHLVAGPLYHTGPLGAVRLLATGVPVTVGGRFDAESVLALIERDHVETAVMVPTHFIRLLALPPEVRARYDVSSLRLIAHTGAACPVHVKRAMINWWGPIFVEAYGATEVGTVCQITSPEWLTRPGSVGRCTPEFKAVVVDEAGVAVRAGTEARLYFRDRTGRGVVYHNDPEKSAAAHLEPGVFTLGEIGYVDDDGYVFITDRFSDMVVSGGANLYPAEAEAVVVLHPRVADVAVIGVPHPEMGEELKALVVPVDPSDPPDEHDVIDFCRARLTPMKCPRSVDVVASLERNAMGKFDKRALRAPYWKETA
jgi:long-chain acyl-CoA synthetase